MNFSKIETYLNARVVHVVKVGVFNFLLDILCCQEMNNQDTNVETLSWEITFLL